MRNTSLSNLSWFFCLYIIAILSCTSESTNDVVDSNSLNEFFQVKLKQVKILQDSFEYDQAIELLKTLRQNTDFSMVEDSLKSNVFHKYGVIYSRKENYNQAINYLDTAIIIRSKIKDYKLEYLANSYYAKSHSMIQLNDEKAITNIQKAIKYIEQSNNKRRIGRYYILMANALQVRGDIGQAEQYFQKILNGKVSDFNDNEKALFYSSYAGFLFLQKNYPKQRDVLEKALNIYKKQGEMSERNFFGTSITLGSSFLYQENWKEADAYFTKLFNKITTSKNSYAKIEQECLNLLAYANLKMNNYKKTRTYYSQLYNLSLKTSPSNYSVAMARAFEGLGDVDTLESKHNSAITNYHKSIQSLFLDFTNSDSYALPSTKRNPIINKKEALRILNSKADTHLRKYKTDKKLIDLETALQIYQFLDDLLTDIRQEYKSASSRFNIVKENIPLYEKASLLALQLHDLTKEKKYLNQAFHFATKNKAIVLQDGLQNEQAMFAGVPSNLLKQENDLKQEYYQLESEVVDLESSGKVSKLLTDKKNERFEVIQKYEKLILKLEQDYPKYYNLKYEANQIIDPDAIAASLPDKAALVEFFVGKSNLFIFTISSKGLTHYAVPKPRKLFTKSRKLRSLLQDSGNAFISEEYLEVANDLYKYLLEKPLADLEKEQEITRLIIIPDNQLLQVSFDALLFEKPETKIEDLAWDSPEMPFLFEKYAISYAYSNKLIMDPTSNKRIKKSLNTFAGFGLEYDDYTLDAIKDLSILEVDTTLSRGMGRLFHSVKEIEEVKDIIGTGKLYRNREATKKSFLKNAPKSKVIHLAMHGYESASHPLNSALIFTRQKGKSDFLLKSADLYTMSLNADMAVLSACHTASGRVYQGEGVRSLARAFRYAGCPSLVATLWSVSDYSTKEIMVDFYKHLKNGDPKDIALQKAKLNYINTGQPSQKAPFFWTHLVLIGETEPLDF